MHSDSSASSTDFFDDHLQVLAVFCEALEKVTCRSASGSKKLRASSSATFFGQLIYLPSSSPNGLLPRCRPRCPPTLGRFKLKAIKLSFLPSKLHTIFTCRILPNTIPQILKQLSTSIGSSKTVPLCSRYVYARPASAGKRGIYCVVR